MDRETAKVFATGRSQAVRLPKKFRFEGDEVYIERRGAQVILTPKPRSWNEYFSKARRLSEDFPERIEDPPPQDRESFP